jgi:hypothetical protein
MPIVKADVVKIDVQRDLALLRPRSLPNRTVRPLQISSQDIEVGADVRAIGHPLAGILLSASAAFAAEPMAPCADPGRRRGAALLDMRSDGSSRRTES